MVENNLFSVAMCVYAKDNAEHFKAAVDSILFQSCPPNEIVLVVDGPVFDELQQIINEYKKNKVFNVIFLAVNSGHGNARRIGLSNCKYPLVALMDSDDISRPNRFKAQLKMFNENPRLDIVGGLIAEFSECQEKTDCYRVVPQFDADIKAYMKKRCPMNQVTVMFHKEAVERAGGYIDWFCEEDYYLWIRMAQQESVFENIKDVLVDVRSDQSMIKRRGGIKYFKSEKRVQRYMYDIRMITLPRYLLNIIERFIIQILVPSRFRMFLFKNFAREKIDENR